MSDDQTGGFLIWVPGLTQPNPQKCREIPTVDQKKVYMVCNPYVLTAAEMKLPLSVLAAKYPWVRN